MFNALTCLSKFDSSAVILFDNVVLTFAIDEVLLSISVWRVEILELSSFTLHCISDLISDAEASISPSIASVTADIAEYTSSILISISSYITKTESA